MGAAAVIVVATKKPISGIHRLSVMLKMKDKRIQGLDPLVDMSLYDYPQELRNYVFTEVIGYYWSKEYPRGDEAEIKGIIAWLKGHIPDAVILYGNDETCELEII